MRLISNYRKFLGHLKGQGIIAALKSSFKYGVFLTKTRVFRHLYRESSENVIENGKIRIAFTRRGVNIFYNGNPVTRGAGLNIGINILGLWTDSTKADWEVLEKTEKCLQLKVIYRDLPLHQIWLFKIVDEKDIIWRADIVTEEWLYIDEFRVITLVNSRYKNWINDYRQGDFLRLDNRWRDLCLDSFPASLVGARFPAGGDFLPAVTLEVEAKNLLPVIQSPPLDADAHIVGFRHINAQGQKEYLPGRYRIFSGRLSLFEDDALLDEKIEFMRQEYLKRETRPESELARSERKLKILLLNLPWQKNGRWGVRAGSRWPHIKDDAEEGNYLPFPFFLAYAANLLRRHDFEVELIDALALKITESKLFEQINRIGPDLLVAETSTPSLQYDLALLEKIANTDFKICLCGPHANMRTPEFLRQHKFIDFILAGEYEYALLNLAQAISCGKGLNGIRGLVFREEDVIVNPPASLIELDALPWPLREGLAMEKYLDTPGRIPLPSVQMLASRGCPFRCNFCLWPQVMYHGNSYRTRSIIDVADEMEYLIRKLGFKSVYFDDDTFNIGKERMLEFCREIKRRGLEKTPWAIMARADLMEQEILTEMRKAGLEAVKYGLESASQELLNSCGKNMDIRKAEKMILFSKSLGIKTHLTFTFGLPGETKATIQKTVDYALRLRPFSVQFSITTPFPGTLYFKELDKNGLIIDKNWEHYDGNFKSVMKLDALSNKELVSARNQAVLAWNKSCAYGEGLRGNWRRFTESYKQGGFTLALKKAYHYLKRKDLRRFISKIKSNYLDLLGIFNGRYAFKGPTTIQIDLTDHCNNNCLACWCNSPLLSKERLSAPRAALPAPLVKRLISEAFQMGTRDIYFSGGGEPFMHPDIFEIIAYAKDLGINCSINTNFTAVDKAVASRLAELEVDNLTVSIWAGSADVYKALHPNKSENDFYRIKDMLLFLNSNKEFCPRIKIYNVICNINYREIKKMMQFAEETKSEFVEFTVVDTIPNATDQLILSDKQRRFILDELDEIKEEFIESQNNGRPKILNVEHFLRRLSNSGAERAEYDSRFLDSMPCYVGWLFARIMPNGDVNSCLKSHRFPVGNIHQSSFKEIWNSKQQMLFRQSTLRVKKENPLFSLIGNDPNIKVGCYKSCDDIYRNLSMHRKIKTLSVFEKCLIKVLSRMQFAKSLSLSKNDG